MYAHSVLVIFHTYQGMLEIKNIKMKQFNDRTCPKQC